MLQDKITATEQLLARIASDFTPAVFASSLALEDMVITDMIARLQLPIAVFTLQTGMLLAETSNMVSVIKTHYGLTVTEYTPDDADVQNYIDKNGQVLRLAFVPPIRCQSNKGGQQTPPGRSRRNT